MKSIQKICVIVAALSLVLSGIAFANESAEGAAVIPGSAAMQWAPQIAYEALTLRVAGPEDTMEYAFGPSELAVFSVYDELGNLQPDGRYKWELRLTPVLPEAVKRALANSRIDGTDADVARQLKRSGLLPDAKLLSQSGTFTIANGSIVDGSLAEEARSGAPISLEAPARSNDGPTPWTAADQVFADDVIVDGSLCVGQDCVNGENFGFDTIRIKENNTRLHFDDTSNSASFPNNDWRLTANESDNGGANKFSIDDATNNKIPFTIEGNAPNNTLYVESDGDVGIKTSNPVVDLHIVEGNTPTLRLEQDGSDGFQAQTWDVAGNETNFFIRDVTNGSKLSFRIEPNTPENTVYLDSTGNVGMGTNGPDQPLHVRRTNGTAGIHVEDTSAGDQVMLLLENAGRTELNLANTTNNSTWGVATLNGAGDLFITKAGSGVNEMTLEGATGNVKFTGTVTARVGQADEQTVPDFVFEPDYKLMPLDDLKSFIEAEKHLPRIPSATDVEAAGGALDMTTMQLRLLEKVEELTLYTLQQQDTIRALQARLDAMDEATP